METQLPVLVRPVMEAYLQALEPLSSHFYGIYLYGSIALDAFEEGESDIDLVALPLEVAWKDVLKTMRYNLDSYWGNKVTHSPSLFLEDGWVTFAVTTLCRILTTVEEGQIIAKSAALRRWRERLPAHFQSLIDEAWRIRHHPHLPSLYPSQGERLKQTVAFIEYVRKRGHEVSAAYPARNMSEE